MVVTKDGEWVSAFHDPSSKEDITPLLAASARTATHADCFDLHGYLPDLYSKFGFYPVARVKFDPAQAPKDWDSEKMDAPDVVMLVHGDKTVDMSKGYEAVKDKIPVMDYDAARAKQHARVAKVSEVRQIREDVRKELEDRVTKMARSHGFAGKVEVVDEPPRWFQVGTQQFQEAAHFDPKDRSIQVNGRQVTDDYLPGLMAHETMHDKWHVIQAEIGREHEEIHQIWTQPNDEWKRLWRVSGDPRDEAAKAEIERRWPVSALFGKTWGDSYAGDFGSRQESRAKMEAEDGVSDYSRAYWKSDRNYDTKMNETLAEIARLDTQGKLGKLNEAPMSVRAQLQSQGYVVKKAFTGDWVVFNKDGSPVVRKSGSKLDKLIKRVNDPDPDVQGDTKPSASWKRLYRGINDQYDRLKDRPAPSTAEPVVKEGMSATESGYLSEFNRKQKKFVKTTGKLGLRHDADLTGERLPEKDMAQYIATVGAFQHKNMLEHARAEVGMKYGGTADFLQHEGEWFDVPDKPPQIPLMTPKECYSNATNMMLNHPGQYDYVEGYYASSHLPMPIEHAWLADKKTGTVVDPTLGWQPTARYFGVAYPKSFVTKKILKNEYYGLHSDGLIMSDLVLGKDKDFKYGQRDISNNK